MLAKQWIKRTIHNFPYVEQTVRKYISEFEARNRNVWSFIPNHELWFKLINTEAAEELSGIKEKINQLENLNRVIVIGGKTIGGTDDIFRLPFREAHAELHNILESSLEGTILIIYSPHPFWANVYQKYSWIPSWDELYAIFYTEPEWRVLQYSPSFDASGRYFFVSQKLSKNQFLCPISELGRRTYHVFYFKEGADLYLSRSNYALSAHLCNALRLTGAKVFAHDFTDVNEFDNVNQGDVLIGHFGPWIKEAANRNIENVILFNPVNRWYPTRNSQLFESNATLEEQVKLSKLIIAQSGMIWRLTADVPEPEKWRWIDIGIDANLFPQIKHEFSPPGKRTFLFFHLYDSSQKGMDIAEKIIHMRDKDKFLWLGGEPIEQRKNLEIHPPIKNISKKFQQLVRECDFILTPSREDAQPGTVVETISLGLLSTATYTSGYSFSYPSLVNPNTPEHWNHIIEYIQSIENNTLLEAQTYFQYYLRTIHSWPAIENMILFYLREFL